MRNMFVRFVVGVAVLVLVLVLVSAREATYVRD